MLGLTPSSIDQARFGAPPARRLRVRSGMIPVMLYEAAQVMKTGARTESVDHSEPGRLKIARRRRMRRRCVALARQLHIIMHRLSVDGTSFRWTPRRSGRHETVKRYRMR